MTDSVRGRGHLARGRAVFWTSGVSASRFRVAGSTWCTARLVAGRSWPYVRRPDSRTPLSVVVVVGACSSVAVGATVIVVGHARRRCDPINVLAPSSGSERRLT